MKNMKGNVLVFVLIVLTLVLVLGTGVVAKSLVSQQHSLKQVSDQQAYYIAKSVLDGMKEHFTNASTASSAAALLPVDTKSEPVTALTEVADQKGRKWDCKVTIENNKVDGSNLAGDEVRITVTAKGRDKESSSEERISMILKQKQETFQGISAKNFLVTGSRVSLVNGSIYAKESFKIENINDPNFKINLKNVVAGTGIDIVGNNNPITIDNLYCGIENDNLLAGKIQIKNNINSPLIINNIFHERADISAHFIESGNTKFVNKTLQGNVAAPKSLGFTISTGDTVNDKFEDNKKYTYLLSSKEDNNGFIKSGSTYYFDLSNTKGVTLEFKDLWHEGVKKEYTLYINNPNGDVIFSESGYGAPVFINGSINAKEVRIEKNHNLNFDFKTEDSNGASGGTGFEFIKYE